MVNIKDFIGTSLLNKRVNFKCECTIPFNITGIVIKYEIIGNEVIWVVESNGKQMKIGENTPKLSVSVL